MRKEYAAALRELFTHALAQACPEFALVPKHKPLAGFPGERAYCSRVSESHFDWVVLVPDAKREAFYVEIGWSRAARFPQLSARPSHAAPDRAGAENEYLCRLGEISGRNDMGWVIEELPVDASQEQMMSYVIAQTIRIPVDVARERIAPIVAQAIGELLDFGVPYLERQSSS